ncbi:MAG: hypothetical protein LH702_07595 [Phormidesmis sp. CAN_BIN44]|nr:hypothetical protein [Phormidesmis sp. CAN_BIN44]
MNASDDGSWRDRLETFHPNVSTALGTSLIWCVNRLIRYQIDPIAQGYLVRDGQKRLRLPPVRYGGRQSG